MRRGGGFKPPDSDRRELAERSEPRSVAALAPVCGIAQRTFHRLEPGQAPKKTLPSSAGAQVPLVMLLPTEPADEQGQQEEVGQ